MTDYLFVDSSHRNRIEYPNPCDFKIPFGAKTIESDILDPILEGTPTSDGIVQAGSTSRTIVLDIGESIVDNVYREMFVKITSGPGNNQYGQIISYNGTTKIAIVGSIWIAPISGGPTVGTTYSIFRGIDNYSPLIYSGPQKSHETYFRVELPVLTIPNDTMLNSMSNIYVHISTVSTKTSRLVFTNNPYINNATFIVPVSDNKHNASFMMLEDCEMVQHIQFKPDDTIIFRVFLENGDPIMFTDTYSPDPPNPLVQVTALFSLRELPTRPPHINTIK